MWVLPPGPGIKPMFPALAGTFLTIGPPGESQGICFGPEKTRTQILWAFSQKWSSSRNSPQSCEGRVYRGDRESSKDSCGSQTPPGMSAAGQERWLWTLKWQMSSLGCFGGSWGVMSDENGTYMCKAGADKASLTRCGRTVCQAVLGTGC